MKQLISIYEGYLIDSIELHEFLKIKTRHRAWVERQFDSFEEGRDYWSFAQNWAKPSGRPAKQFFLTVNMAKQLAMLAKTDVGEMVREYFIRVEDRVNKLNKLKETSESLKEETKLNLESFKKLDNAGLETLYEGKVVKDKNAHMISITGRTFAQELTKHNIFGKKLTLEEYIEENRKTHLEIREMIIKNSNITPEELPLFQLKKIDLKKGIE
ncbi:antA/AntB antirepressor family protein [Flexithrix dorotheae]|uniref:antA/AntB antirepressor family protein n=1 Tax=Flexithrix dorotheae TaxID=70993 RepID=UPI0003629EE3|nr:antA/AntB antirepressor family protein [Flexithrix dorotheae]